MGQAAAPIVYPHTSPLLNSDYSNVQPSLVATQYIKDCISELTTAFAITENPEALFNDVNLKGKISHIQALKPRDEIGLDSETKSTLTALRSTFGFWTKYNLIINSVGKLNLNFINSDYFFHKLAFLSPDKAMKIIDKLDDRYFNPILGKYEEGYYNQAIQIVLPHLEKFKDEETKQRFLKLAADYCNLPEFLMPRVERKLPMQVADLLAKLGEYNAQFNSVMVPLKLVSDPEVIQLNFALNQLGIYEKTLYSHEFKELCSEFQTNFDVWTRYSKYKEMTISEFNPFFKKLITLRPKLALKVLIEVSNEIKFKVAKTKAYEDYLNWFYSGANTDPSSLLFESELYKESFLKGAYNCGIFIKFPKFKQDMMAEINRIRQSKQDLMYCNMVKGLMNQLDKNDPKLCEVCKELQKFTKEDDARLVKVLSTIPPKILGDMNFPPDYSLVWLGEIDNQKCDGKGRMELVKEESLCRSIYSSLMNNEMSFDKSNDIVVFFKELFQLDKDLAGNFIIKYFKALSEKQIEAIGDLCVKFYTDNGKELFSDMSWLSWKQRRALLNVVCMGLISKREGYLHYKEKHESDLRRAIELADGLNSSDRNELFQKIATDQIETPFQDRFNCAVQVDRSSRGQVLLTILQNTDFWTSNSQLKQILDALQKGKYDAELLDIIKSIRRLSDAETFCMMISDYIQDPTMKSEAFRIIKGSF